MQKSNKLKNLFCLSSKIAVYIPSTVDVNKKCNNAKYVNEAKNLMSLTFGGSTVQNVLGSFITEKNETVNEKINIVYSYCTSEQLQNNTELIIEFCEKLKIEMSQESIALEINNKLYFV